MRCEAWRRFTWWEPYGAGFLITCGARSHDSSTVKTWRAIYLFPSRCTATFIQSYASFPAVFPIRASTNAIVVSHATRYRNTSRSTDTDTIDGFGFTSTSPSPGC